MSLDTVAKIRYAFYRLVGTTGDDAALTDQGEATDDVAYLYLTRGVWAAQRWMLKMGYNGWYKRSSALSWTGTDATTGGRYWSLPSDFLRAFGDYRVSCLREANGDPWGQLITSPYDEGAVEGDYYYFRGDELWLARTAAPPTTLYLEYHHQHPAFSAAVTLDFPVEARPLIVAEAANLAKEEDWLPYGQEVEQKIERALIRAREEARDIARPTKAPRQFRRPIRYGNRW